MDLTDYSPITPEWELFDLVADPSEMNNYHRDRNIQFRDSSKRQLLHMKVTLGDEDRSYPALHAVEEKH